MNLSNLKIAHKLALGFGAMLILLLLISTTMYFRFERVSDQVDLVVNNLYPKVELLQGVRDGLNHTTATLSDLVVTDNPAARKDAEQSMLADSAVISTNLGQLERILQRPEARALLEQLEGHRKEFLAQRTRYTQLLDSGERDAAIDLLHGPLSQSRDAYVKVLDQLIALQKVLMRDSGAETTKMADQAGPTLMLLVAAALLACSLLGWWISRSITVPLAAAVASARRVASGDLAPRATSQRRDEIGQLLQAQAEMTASLRDIVGQVQQGSDQIASAASQIAAGNLDLSGRTEQQASALEETAASLEQLTVTVSQNSDNAQQAQTLAQQASNAARDGSSVVHQAVASMEQISNAAKQINDIISVIDSIAFQTNILALNAAVEAARAGEQGRGFAVVATEVRNLAQRSATAAKDIKTLISNTDTHVGAGVALVQQAGAGMDQLVQRITAVSAVMHDIVMAGQQQSAGLGQINAAVSQMDHVTQQNAALVEEAAAAAAALQAQAGSLLHAVGVFQLDAGGASRTAAPAYSTARPPSRAPRALRPVPQLVLSA
ncbi:MAG: methyl-accepting chemotaxis protein [Sphingomonadaceae bacterium]